MLSFFAIAGACVAGCWWVFKAGPRDGSRSLREYWEGRNPNAYRDQALGAGVRAQRQIERERELFRLRDKGERVRSKEKKHEIARRIIELQKEREDDQFQ